MIASMVKRLLIFILSAVCIMTLAVVQKTSFIEHGYDNSDEYFFYVNNNDVVLAGNVEVVNNGNGAIVITNYGTAKDIEKTLKGVYGQAVNTARYSDIEQIVADFKIVDLEYENVDGVVVCVGFSKKLSQHILVNDKPINIQIAKTQKGFMIGYPLILHSF